MSYFAVRRTSRVHWFNRLSDADAARFVGALESVRQFDWLPISRSPEKRVVITFGQDQSLALEVGEPREDIPSVMRALNRELSRAIYQRLRSKPTFRECVLREAVRGLLDDNIDLTKGLLRRLIDATIGFDDLAVRMEGNPKSLVRMLSPAGNPSARNLIGILARVAEANRVAFRVELTERSKLVR